MKQLEDFFGRIEKWVLFFLLGFLLAFSLLQIVLRNFFSTGFVWGDSLLRNTVLWISFLGAARATAEDKHIRIDLLPRLLPTFGATLSSLIIDLFSLFVCIALILASWRFVMDERVSGGFAFSQVPLWWFEVIFPFSFAVMLVRFGIHLGSTAMRMIRSSKGGPS